MYTHISIQADTLNSFPVNILTLLFGLRKKMYFIGKFFQLYMDNSTNMFPFLLVFGACTKV